MTAINNPTVVSPPDSSPGQLLGQGAETRASGSTGPRPFDRRKRRAAIPRNAVVVTGKNAMAVAWQDGCIGVISLRYYEALIDAFEQLGRYDRQMRRVLRLFASDATTVTIEEDGRLTLSESLVDYAGIDESFVGNVRGWCGEIWATERWKKERSGELTLTAEQELITSALERLLRPDPSRQPVQVITRGAEDHREGGLGGER